MFKNDIKVVVVMSVLRSFTFLELFSWTSFHKFKFSLEGNSIYLTFLWRKISWAWIFWNHLSYDIIYDTPKNHIIEILCVKDIALLFFSGSSCRVGDTLFSRQPCTDTRRTYHLYRWVPIWAFWWPNRSLCDNKSIWPSHSPTSWVRWLDNLDSWVPPQSLSSPQSIFSSWWNPHLLPLQGFASGIACNQDPRE